jgi:hypothetical protein
MHSGFRDDGSPKTYTAQVSTIKRIVDFTPQNNASNPPYLFGYIQMLYDQVAFENLIQVKFSLPPNQNFTVKLSITTNVQNSTFNFTIDGTNQTKIATNNGINILKAVFNGNSTGQYNLIINPNYQMDFTTFLLTEIKIIQD